MSVVIKVENLSKYYRLGVIGGGTLREDLGRWWAMRRGKPDPLLKIGKKDHGNRKDGQIWALKDINLEVKEGEILGIIGGNGAGKSTLLKIISRITAPTEGKIKIKGRIASLLEVGTGFHPELTGRENIFLNGTILGMSKKEVSQKLDEIVEFAEMREFIDTPVKRYSSGMTVRLAFAVAAHLEPEIMVIDEVLAVGDASFQKKCLGKMGEVGKSGRTVLFVSHNMNAIRQLCGDAALLKAGRVEQIDKSAEVTERYLSSMLASSAANGPHSPGFLYSSNDRDAKPEFSITGIQLLDANDRPKEVLGTWDYVKIRVHHAAKAAERNGSVVLKIQTREGATLILCSTAPDSRVPYQIVAGAGHADCIFPSWPLAAGVYVLGAGLAVPKIKFLCLENSLCELHVVERDVYGSGLAPTSSRYLVASEHFWEV
jgi:lipopolysaccharide transport system ATP-binding protein